MKLKILGPLAIAGAVAIASAFGTTFADGEESDADLTLTKEVSDASVEVGETVTFTLTVSNEGPATSTAVTLTDPLPAGLGFVSVASDSGVCGEASGDGCDVASPSKPMVCNNPSPDASCRSSMRVQSQVSL